MLEKPPQLNVASKVLPLLYQISLLVFNPFAPENLAEKKIQNYLGDFLELTLHKT